MKMKRAIAGFLAGTMLIVPIQVRAAEITYDVYTFTDMNNLTVSIPASLPLSYSWDKGAFSGTGNVTVSGTNTSTTDYSVEIAVDSVNIDYTNQSDSNAVASGTVSFGTNGIESWTKDEVAGSTAKNISVEVADFPEVEGMYSSNINYTINVNKLVNDIYFTKTVDDSTMTCTITGLTTTGNVWISNAIASGDVYAPDGTKDAGELIIPEKLTVSGKQYTVTTIGSSAFLNHSELTSLVLGDTVTVIGMQAFKDCSNLASIDFGSGVLTIGAYAFEDCSGLSSINFRNSVLVIGDYAFRNCNGLTSLDLGNGVTTIGDNAFYGCSGLTSVTIPDSVTSIGGSAFEGCTGLTSVDLGNGVTTIGGGAFFNCSGLTGDLIIPDSVTTIGDLAFYNCSSLTGDLIIPDSVTTIGGGAFRYCNGLTSLTLGNNVITIGDSAFMGCWRLTGALFIPNSVTTIGSSVFEGCSGLTGDLVIPDGISTIESYTFYDCSGLTSITIPDSVTTINFRAFAYCSGLTDVYYAGTEADKGNITIDSSNDYLLDATWHYQPASSLSLRPIEELEILEEDGIEVIDSELLAAFPDIKLLVLPKTIKRIEENAFASNTVLETVKYAGSPSMWDKIDIAEQGNDNLFNAELIFLEEDETDNGTEDAVTEYTISDGVCSIDENLLSTYTELETLNIPVSVTEICSNAFLNNTALETVNYAGTEEQWNNVTISSEGNANLFNAEIIFAENEEESSEEESSSEESSSEESSSDEESNEGESSSEESSSDEESSEEESFEEESSEEESSEEESSEEESSEQEPASETPEIEENTEPINSEEPSSSPDDFVAPIKDESTEEEAPEEVSEEA